ncbi:hypothetical protein T190607A02C_20552 [Tenacibaculum sp. 190524A02b]
MNITTPFGVVLFISTTTFYLIFSILLSLIVLVQDFDKEL